MATTDTTPGSKLFEDVADSVGTAAGNAAADKLIGMLKDPVFRHTLEAEVATAVIAKIDPWLMGSVFLAGGAVGGVVMWFITRKK